MSLTLRWVGEDELDRVADTRMRCFGHSTKDFERYRELIRTDTRARPGDYLLAERDDIPIGTTTSLSMTMWVRGSPVPCQGVAWVGTVKTHRRRIEGEEGVATQLMRETLRAARERGQVVSALMPFRASFYEHFGYGLVERRNEWTVPLAVLPHGTAAGLRFYRPTDFQELARFRQRIVEGGQCDIERPNHAWEDLLRRTDSGVFIVDRADSDGPVRGYLFFEHEKNGAKDYLRIVQNNYEDIPALKRQLHFLASLRDQYSAALIPLPSDLPLNLLLRETQLPHRSVNHATAELRPHTRMQVRILDHKRFLEVLRLPQTTAGRVVVEVLESEGQKSRFAIDIAEGQAGVSPSSTSAEFSCPDRIWAAVACGDLPATRAVELGLASSTNSDAPQLLDRLSSGPLPFSSEYF
jgi:predicted acetyltransferase